MKRVSDTRNRTKLSKSQKVWFEVFDQVYGERVKSSNDIIDIILEQGNKHGKQHITIITKSIS